MVPLLVATALDTEKTTLKGPSTTALAVPQLQQQLLINHWWFENDKIVTNPQ